MYREVTLDNVLTQDIISVIAIDIGDMQDAVQGFRIYQNLEYDEPITFGKLKEEIDRRYKGEGTMCIVLAEDLTFGEVYKFNNYGKKEWFKTGETLGYA